MEDAKETPSMDETVPVEQRSAGNLNLTSGAIPIRVTSSNESPQMLTSPEHRHFHTPSTLMSIADPPFRSFSST